MTMAYIAKATPTGTYTIKTKCGNCGVTNHVNAEFKGQLDCHGCGKRL